MKLWLDDISSGLARWANKQITTDFILWVGWSVSKKKGSWSRQMWWVENLWQLFLGKEIFFYRFFYHQNLTTKNLFSCLYFHNFLIKISNQFHTSHINYKQKSHQNQKETHSLWTNKAISFNINWLFILALLDTFLWIWT